MSVEGRHTHEQISIIICQVIAFMASHEMSPQISIKSAISISFMHYCQSPCKIYGKGDYYLPDLHRFLPQVLAGAAKHALEEVSILFLATRNECKDGAREHRHRKGILTTKHRISKNHSCKTEASTSHHGKFRGGTTLRGSGHNETLGLEEDLDGVERRQWVGVKLKKAERKKSVRFRPWNKQLSGDVSSRKV